ncbi:dihydrofolate reductase [Paenibacillus turpanensis]|uniref:dihydrofolate reductase n=1 Tax=Paenibacillus turpanensis TaxID=2689078 RepID=UPI00140C9C8C|nr:dihydrofolate reductase [Paenibacillus turpanensis]
MVEPGFINLLWAMDDRRVIGYQNTLPWRLPADLAYVKQVTMGHPLVMGRRTYESIGRPLPGRTNVIVTRQKDYAPEGCVVVHSFEEVRERFAGQPVFIFGGADLFRSFLPLADKLYVTRISGTFEGDTFFPEYDESQWELEFRREGMVDEKNRHPHVFEVYRRKEQA